MVVFRDSEEAVGLPPKRLLISWHHAHLWDNADETVVVLSGQAPHRSPENPTSKKEECHAGCFTFCSRACRLRPILLYVSVILAAVFPQWLRAARASPDATSPSQASHDDTAARSASSHDATPEELLRQLHDNKLSAERIAAATAQVLRLQADEKTAWEPSWGEFVAHAHQQGKLPADLWYKYLLGTVQLEVKVAAETNRADGLAVWYEFKSPHGARMGLTALSAVGER